MKTISELQPCPFGLVAPGFEAVAEAFERNFTERGEIGAAFAAEFDGAPVVDLWGGIADPESGRPWRRDTLQLVFSGTKGLVAVCMLLLIERSELELGAPVCAYWPEFAANGKAAITVAEVVSHRSRMPGVRAPLQIADLVDDVRMAALLAEQAPETDPRAAGVYHQQTYGWMCGELVRRVSGRSIGRFFAEEVARPLELEIWIGLPEHEEPRVSTLVDNTNFAPPESDPDRVHDDLYRRSWFNPPAEPGKMHWNERAFHAAEIPGAGAITTARSMARLYSCLARGGEVGGIRLLRPETIALGRRELSRFRDPFSDEPMAFGVGFQLQTELATYGPPAQAFGHSGAGGSIHAAWPEQRVGVSYAMNEMRYEPAGDPRSQSLLAALSEAVSNMSD
jgi:CubicO group peptidase (beta-lactamase class C family)